MASERAVTLFDAGAQVQRPLWASTSTKDPSYFDLLYVDTIVADETVNTMPDATLAATLDHGNFANSELRSAESTKEAAEKLEQLPDDVSLDTVTEKLEIDGVNAFVASYEELLATVKAKMQANG
jgi:transaldolase